MEMPFKLDMLVIGQITRGKLHRIKLFLIDDPVFRLLLAKYKNYISSHVHLGPISPNHLLQGTVVHHCPKKKPYANNRPTPANLINPGCLLRVQFVAWSDIITNLIHSSFSSHHKKLCHFSHRRRSSALDWPSFNKTLLSPVTLTYFLIKHNTRPIRHRRLITSSPSRTTITGTQPRQHIHHRANQAALR